MITPIRGRKLRWTAISPYPCGFRNDNPDKGTETDSELAKANLRRTFRNDNPDKGTETNKNRTLFF